MPVLLHRHTAAAGGHHDRLDLAALDRRPPGIDQRASRALERPAPRLRLDDAAADVDEAAVAHAGRTGGLAGTARQAAVEVQARLAGHRRAFERALHEVDAAARTVEVVAEHLVGRAGGGAEAAVHAFAQDGLGLAPLGRVADEVGELGLHGSLYFSHESAGLVRRVRHHRRANLFDRALAPQV